MRGTGRDAEKRPVVPRDACRNTNTPYARDPRALGGGGYGSTARGGCACGV